MYIINNYFWIILLLLLIKIEFTLILKYIQIFINNSIRTNKYFLLLLFDLMDVGWD